jgi:hypothetical protein
VLKRKYLFYFDGYSGDRVLKGKLILRNCSVVSCESTNSEFFFAVVLEVRLCANVCEWVVFVVCVLLCSCCVFVGLSFYCATLLSRQRFVRSLSLSSHIHTYTLHPSPTLPPFLTLSPSYSPTPTHIHSLTPIHPHPHPHPSVHTLANSHSLTHVCNLSHSVCCCEPC